MQCPFPGMDPWLEHPHGWGGVHTRLITRSSDYLQPLLADLGFFVDIEERVYIVDSEREVVPDLVIEPMTVVRGSGARRAAVLEADEPVLVPPVPEQEIRERFLQVLTLAGRELVTQIEIISLTNKKSKHGRELYLQKRRELRDAGVNLVKIDLLRDGPALVDVERNALRSLKPWDYVVSVSRAGQLDREAYAISLRERLPRIRIPLRDEMPDVVLDLQTVFQQTYESGPYPARCNHDQPPLPPLSREDDAWADRLLRAAGLRA